MSAVAALTAAWLALGLVLVRRHAQEWRDHAAVATTTSLLTWLWHGLVYSAILLASAEHIWLLPLEFQRVSPVFLLGGIGLLAAAFESFGSFGRLSATRLDELMTSGIYRHSRHPQYLALVITMAGVAMVGRSGIALALTGAFALALLLFIPVEERHLERVFGDRYRRYRARTPILVGLRRSAERRPGAGR